MSTFRKGRTAVFTIDELLQSKRLDLAVESYRQGNKKYLRSILIELIAEDQEVVRNTLISVYGKHYSLDKKEMKPLLKSVTDFTTFNLYWSISKDEIEMIEAELRGDVVEYNRLLEKVKARFMLEC